MCAGGLLLRNVACCVASLIMLNYVANQFNIFFCNLSVPCLIEGEALSKVLFVMWGWSRQFGGDHLGIGDTGTGWRMVGKYKEKNWELYCPIFGKQLACFKFHPRFPGLVPAQLSTLIPCVPEVQWWSMANLERKCFKIHFGALLWKVISFHCWCWCWRRTFPM